MSEKFLSVADLEAMPEYSVVLADNNDVYQKQEWSDVYSERVQRWFCAGDGHAKSSEWVANHLNVIELYRPRPAWHDAKPGSVWDITIDGQVIRAFVYRLAVLGRSFAFYQSYAGLGSGCAVDNTKITAAVLRLDAPEEAVQ